ncbi:MAG: hypothetical protein N3A53_05880, partial [Verrucomicrobiae bacterium]|nr:hypothetical protein [Verrucomicrobiae bacterium]
MTTLARWFRITPTTLLWCGLFLLLALSNWRVVLVNADSDAAWHWRNGEWMLQHRTWMRSDPFSHTRAGEPYVSKDWLSEVALAMAGRAGGWSGVALVAAAVIAGVYAGLWRAMTRAGNHCVWAMVVVALAAWAGTAHWIARPHLATHALTTLAAWQLYQFHLGRRSSRQLAAWLLPVAVLWPNLHGAFLNLFVLLGIYLVATGIERYRQRDHRSEHARRCREFLMLTAGCALGTLLNPYGWQLHAHILEFLRTPEVAFFTREWRSPNFHSDGLHGWLAMVGALVVVALVIRPRFAIVEHLLIVVWGYLALYAVRNVPLFGLVVAPILAEHGSRWLQEQSGRFQMLTRMGARWTTAEQRGHGAGWAAAVFVVTWW